VFSYGIPELFAESDVLWRAIDLLLLRSILINSCFDGFESSLDVPIVMSLRLSSKLSLKASKNVPRMLPHRERDKVPGAHAAVPTVSFFSGQETAVELQIVNGSVFSRY
jgi:hypothetical protein